MGLTQHQIDVCILIERVTACISVTGTLMLLTTFIIFKEFRTLSNTLIFYASFANLFANVAALIGGSGFTKGLNSALCQFQAFLLEMFMQSDPFWACAMSINVYLVFFWRFDASRLKKMYWIYGLACYGLPFIPAMVCLLLKTKEKGRIYGNATLWCWIDNEWAPLRMYSYYVPIWISILITFLIYIRVGIDIFQKRSQLRAMGGDNYAGDLSTSHGQTTSGNDTTKVDLSPFTGTRTTEVEVTRDQWTSENEVENSPKQAYNGESHRAAPKDMYSVTISAAIPQDGLAPPSRHTTTYHRRRNHHGVDKVKWAYLKVALLFAMSILITWVPASINRIYGLIHPNTSFALNIGSALVLPLQGFWNTVIYFTTSLPICRELLGRWKMRANAGSRLDDEGGDDSRRRGFNVMEMVIRKKDSNKESDSMVGFSRTETGSF
ncbi:G-protein-like protein coupled receptor [Xylogone sp. PMI_703]|nr:G-protein-like protein coupled receptor [Xylogone sp. PMI_703]